MPSALSGDEIADLLAEKEAEYEAAALNLVNEKLVLEQALRAERANTTTINRHAFVQQQRWAAEKSALEGAGMELQARLIEAREATREIVDEVAAFDTTSLLEEWIAELRRRYDWLREPDA